MGEPSAEEKLLTPVNADMEDLDENGGSFRADVVVEADVDVPTAVVFDQ